MRQRPRGGLVLRQQFPQLRTARHIRSLVDLRQHQAGFHEEQAPSLAQLDPTIGALEQPRADLLFQRLDLLAQGRLGDPQNLGGPAEMQLFSHGDEVAQVAQFHENLIRS